MIEAGVDTVVLGCTHYPLVRAVLQRALGRGAPTRIRVTPGRAGNSGAAIPKTTLRANRMKRIVNDMFKLEEVLSAPPG